MSAIDNMPTVACFRTWTIGKWIIMDNRLGGVDNICVLRRRTARNAVTRPTTGHSEGDRLADISMAQTDKTKYASSPKHMGTCIPLMYR